MAVLSACVALIVRPYFPDQGESEDGHAREETALSTGQCMCFVSRAGGKDRGNSTNALYS